MSITEIRIGQYRFSKNLGNGSFGKVKSKSNTPFNINTLKYSGIPRVNRAQSGNQNFKQEKDQAIRCLRESEKRT